MDKDLLRIRKVVEKEFAVFQQRFSDSLVADSKLIQDVFTFIKNKKGKQIRPMLVLLSGKLCGEINENSWRSAVALEMLHTASLLHDDVVDETLERRGHQSVNAMFGNTTAVLVGDLLLTKSIQPVLLCGSKSLEIFVNLGKRIAEGELLQLEKSFCLPSEADYFKIIQYKTAALFSACLEMGALAVGASNEKVEKLRIFGEYMGYCFQMKDDIFDYTSQAHIGKPILNDIREGKITLPLICALDKTTEQEQEEFGRFLEKQSVSDEMVAVIKKMVDKYDGCAMAARKMEEYAAKGREVLATFPDSVAKTALLDMLHYTMSRTN
ncbi:MAG: Octaprenyl-diphosphate synthase [Bacteroidetes bacterium ADurb.Bin057]|jgi:octaprenyl-diphosphate synthase|nr:MAG: Octaprenyl-diphosphate synthase [Bacteroidetes bacterium ADurb.Bin057]HPH72402.1 polyprenyl synthetase family protein [Paludibacteraceae bacterium]HPO47240.1 polyprenyl synthetase family protein [Paludibacteraceae bacterium]